MTGYCFSSNHSSHCTMFAAAGTSVRLDRILDTAILAVSVFIVHLIGILVLTL